MKQIQRIPALTLALVLLLTALTGCNNGKLVDVAPPDQVAEAFFDVIICDDASTITEVLDYESEAAARADLGLDDGSLYEAMAQEVTSQLSSLGTVTDEDSRTMVDAFLTMMRKLTFNAEVKEQDDKKRTAVVTCHVSTISADAVQNAMTDAVTKIATENPELISDEDALVSAVIQAMAQAMSAVEPTADTADFDVDFTLQMVEVDGKDKWMWFPKDTEAFGSAISTAALGG